MSQTILNQGQCVVGVEELLYYFIATSKPGELRVNSMPNTLGIAKVSVDEIIDALVQMKSLRSLKPDATGAKLVRGEPKILFTHPKLG